MSETILVLGATGTVGSAVVEGSSRRGVRVVAASRDPEAAAARRPDVRWVRFDLEQPETFGPALDGVARVFLVARPGDEQPERVAVPFLREASARGVRHVVNLTAMGAEQREDFGLRKVERALEASGMAWTHLRPNWFFQVFDAPPLGPALRATGTIAIPAGDAKISYVDARDVADMGVAALTEPGHEGAAYTLTGPSAMTMHEVAETLSAFMRRPIRYLPLSEDDGRAGLQRAGFSSERVERLVGFYRFVRAGACAPIHDDVPRVLGRPARDLARYLEDHAARFR